MFRKFGSRVAIAILMLAVVTTGLPVANPVGAQGGGTTQELISSGDQPAPTPTPMASGSLSAESVPILDAPIEGEAQEAPESANWVLFRDEYAPTFIHDWWMDNQYPYSGNVRYTHGYASPRDFSMYESSWMMGTTPIPSNTTRIVVTVAVRPEVYTASPNGANHIVIYIAPYGEPRLVGWNIGNSLTNHPFSWERFDLTVPEPYLSALKGKRFGLDIVVYNRELVPSVFSVDRFGAWFEAPDPVPTWTPSPTPTRTPSPTPTRTPTPWPTASATPWPTPRPCPSGGCKIFFPRVKKQNPVQCHPGWWGYWSEVVETFPHLAARTNIPETILIPGNIGLDGFIDIGDPVCLPNDPNQAWFEENGLTAIFDQPRSLFIVSNLALVALDGPLPLGDAVVIGRLARNGAQVARIIKTAAPIVGVTVLGWLGIRNVPASTPVVTYHGVFPINPGMGWFNQTTVTKFGLDPSQRYFLYRWDGTEIPDDAVEAIWFERPQSTIIPGGFVLRPNWEDGAIFPMALEETYLQDYSVLRGNGHLDDTSSGIGRPEQRRALAQAIANVGYANPQQYECWKRLPEPGRWGSARALVYRTAQGIVTFLHNLDTGDRTLLEGDIPGDDQAEYERDWRMATAAHWAPCDPIETNFVIQIMDDVLDYLGIPHSPVGMEVNKPE